MRSFVVFCFACAAPAFAQLKVVTPEVAAQPPAHPAPVATPVWAPDGMSFAWRHKDGLHVYDIRSRSRRRVVATEALEGQAAKVPSEPAFTWENRRVTEHQLQWFPDGRTFLVSVGQDLFTVDVVSAKIRQLTSTAEAERDPKLSPDGKSVSFIRGNEVWVLPTAGGLARKLTSGSSATVWNGRTDWVYPEELDLGTAHWWSPNSRTIAFLQFDVSRQVVYPHAHLVPVEAVYEPQRYPKAGTPNADVKLGVVAADGGQVRWMDINGGNDSLLARVQWLPDSRRIAVQRLNRVQNRLDLVFVAGDSGEARTVLTETDPHWIDISNDLHFLDGEKFVWSSERSGYRHLYVFDESGKQVTQLTSGNFEIKSVVAVDRRQKLVYFESRERTPVGVDLWTVPLGGGTRNLITKAAGVHQVSMPAKSPQYYIDTWSTSADPTRKTLHSVSGEQLDIIVAVPPASTEYIYIRPEILTLKAADGETLYARLIRPSNFDSSKKYPAIVLAYGGPHAQDVLDVWMGLTAQQAFAQAGYVVWQLDNRGTAGRGQAFETKLYRRLGKQELEDQAHGVRHLLQMGFVDAQRVGIHGWSYGGFLTLYAMAEAPDLFAAGVAGAPVTDWRNYDTIYTERYLGLPSENEEGYKASSPVHKAASIRAPLLLVANVEDDNVLFQHTLQMSAALQKEGKLFEMSIYPQRTHGVTGDLRKHFYRTMFDFFGRQLRDKLPQ